MYCYKLLTTNQIKRNLEHLNQRVKSPVAQLASAFDCYHSHESSNREVGGSSPPGGVKSTSLKVSIYLIFDISYSLKVVNIDIVLLLFSLEFQGPMASSVKPPAFLAVLCI